MGFLDSIKNLFSSMGQGKLIQDKKAESATTAPVTQDQSVVFGFNPSSTQSVPSLSTETSTSAFNSEIKPQQFTPKQTEPTPADSLEEPTVDLQEVQGAVTQSFSSPQTGAGFNASENLMVSADEEQDEESPASIREQIQEGLMSVLNNDQTDEKARLREEAGIEEKAKTSNRILNTLRKIRVDFEAEKAELKNNNEEGRSMGAINNDINKLTEKTNRNLAYKSIEYDVARGDLVSAESTLNARLQDMKDEETKQVQLYKTLYDFVQDDMSESEKIEAQQAFSKAESERSFERSKELAQYNSLLRREEKQLSMALAQAVTSQEAEQASKALIPSLQSKVGQINEAISGLEDGTIGNVVGGNKLARFSVGKLFGAGQNFIANVDQMTSRETLDTLIALKAKGGTLGALSERIAST